MGAATPTFAQTIKGNVYGGGNLSQVEGSTTINIKSGGITFNAEGNDEGNDEGNIYGGGYGASAVLAGNTTINVTGGTISKDVYGGGALANVTGSTEVNIEGGTVTQDVYGGGALANVGENTSVNLAGGSIRNSYGGGLGSSEVAALIGGNTTTILNGSIVLGNVFGCNNLNGTPQGHVLVDVKKTAAKGTETTEHPYHVAGVYGGGNLAAYVPTDDKETTEVIIEHCDNSIEDVFGGGNAAAVPETDVTVWGGQIGRVFAGGNGVSSPANVTRDTHVMIHGGTIKEVYGGSNNSGDIGGIIHVDVAELKYQENDLCPINVDDLYGGGNLAASNAGQINIGKCNNINRVFGGAHNADVNGNITLAINDGHIGNVFGGNNESGDINGSITVNIQWVDDAVASLGNVYGGGNLAAYTVPEGKQGPTVNLVNGKVNNDIFGGGYGVGAVVTGNPEVNVTGGSAANVYGGGALADVKGNTTVNLTEGTVGAAYGGGLGAKAGVNGATEDVKAIVDGDATVSLNGTKVTGEGIFGANNLNGTPTGHVKVHVTSTTPRDGFEYAVPAVYGGGNLSAYEPTNTKEFAEVLIENCDNSIEYVYGGGNAAPVPATSVTIYGANAINHAFAGGNGAGTGNLGADVGYLEYKRDEEHKYGTGLASITIYGGTVYNVYGGSNTLGYIRGGTSVNVENGDGDCPLFVGNVFGGGNKADIDCSVTMNLNCNEGGAMLYAGANNANVNGDITLNIYSGTYGKVFCGNNEGGKVFGSLEVNVDETGCWPVMIGELYACGNVAPYSVYGYEDELADGKVVVKTSGEKFYRDPVINLISFTRIGKVFGGGYGENAVLYGNTHVNVEPIKGKFAGYDGTEDKQISPTFVLNGNDERVPFAKASTLPDGIDKNGSYLVIPDEVGSIGSIYGGGNQGTVHGDTNVNIGTLETNQHRSGEDKATQNVSVRITDDVFGGGKTAEVTGKATVKIGK